MSDARKIYERTEVGAVGCAQAGESTVAVLESFQSSVVALEELEAEGRIEITKRHQESETSRRFVDFVMFRRLK